MLPGSLSPKAGLQKLTWDAPNQPSAVARQRGDQNLGDTIHPLRLYVVSHTPCRVLKYISAEARTRLIKKGLSGY